MAPATAGAYQRQGASTAMLDALNLADLVAAAGRQGTGPASTQRIVGCGRKVSRPTPNTPDGRAYPYP